MNYKPSDEIVNCFSSLFLAVRVPYQLDINYEYSTEQQNAMEKGLRVSYLIQATTAFCIELMNLKNDLLNLSTHSFPSKHFSCAGSFNSVTSLNFFKLLSKAFFDHDENTLDDIISYFCERAKYVVLFNKVKPARINSMYIVFHELFDFVTGESSALYPTIKFDQKMCDCDDYKQSGDCFCQIEDIQK